jgi:hypothetical protein
LGFFHFLLLAVASDKAYQLLAHGRWFSPASSTSKIGRHDIAEISITESGVKHQKSNQSTWITGTFVINNFNPTINDYYEKAGSKYTHNLDN